MRSVNMLTKNLEELRVYVAINNITSGACNISSLADGEDYREYMKSRYGVPGVLTGTLESFFQELHPSEAIQFFTSLLDSIACDGKDLSKVIWRFLALELRQLPGVELKAQAVIEGMDLLSEGKPWPGAYHAAQAANVARDVGTFSADAACNAYAADAVQAAAYAAVQAAYAAVQAAQAVYAVQAAYSADVAYAVYAARAARAAAHASRAAAYFTESYNSSRKRQRATLLKLIEKAPTPPWK